MPAVAVVLQEKRCAAKYRNEYLRRVATFHFCLISKSDPRLSAGETMSHIAQRRFLSNGLSSHSRSRRWRMSVRRRRAVGSRVDGADTTAEDGGDISVRNFIAVGVNLRLEDSLRQSWRR